MSSTAALVPNTPNDNRWLTVKVWCEPAAAFRDREQAERFADEQRAAGALGVEVVDGRPVEW